MGAFSSAQEALMAAVDASELAPREFKHSKIMVSDGKKRNGDAIHRARIANLDEKNARRACQKLISKQQSCFVFRNKETANSL